jgi:DNA adenine methylase
MRVAPVLKYPGAKWNLSGWICSFVDRIPHNTYTEPFFGSGAVFFNKQPSNIETINDLDQNVVNLFRMVRDRGEDLANLIYMTPWARDEYLESYEKTGDDIEDARRFIVRCWQAFATKTSGRTGWRSDVHGRKKSCPSYWSKLPGRLLAVIDRLKQAEIENQPAVKILQRYAFDNVLIYADPPYLQSSRASRQYACEMLGVAEHMQLLELLDDHPGPVLLSAYQNHLYDERLRHWHKETKLGRAELGRVREEVLWLNPVAIDEMRRVERGTDQRDTERPAPNKRVGTGVSGRDRPKPMAAGRTVIGQGGEISTRTVG